MRVVAFSGERLAARGGRARARVRRAGPRARRGAGAGRRAAAAALGARRAWRPGPRPILAAAAVGRARFVFDAARADDAVPRAAAPVRCGSRCRGGGRVFGVGSSVVAGRGGAVGRDDDSVLCFVFAAMASSGCLELGAASREALSIWRGREERRGAAVTLIANPRRRRDARHRARAARSVHVLERLNGLAAIVGRGAVIFVERLGGATSADLDVSRILGARIRARARSPQQLASGGRSCLRKDDEVGAGAVALPSSPSSLKRSSRACDRPLRAVRRARCIDLRTSVSSDRQVAA